MEPDDGFLPLSALQYYEFCPRQCALIHGEAAWAENRLTAEGRVLHEKVHNDDDESRGEVRIARGLRLRSLRHRLAGVADVVEFRRDDAGAKLPGVAGRWRPYPVEYKRGRPKRGMADKRQLAAQALCLGEMLAVPVPTGALYYGTPRRREEVVFTAAMLEETAALAEKALAMLDAGITPAPTRGAWCESCSLAETCLPSAHGRSARHYLARMLEDDAE